LDYGSSYRKFVDSLLSGKRAGTTGAVEHAMAEAVGGYFDEFSELMLKILVEAGLKPEHYLIDVGCGSGRLTKSAASYLTGRYLGTDVVPALLANAQKYGKPGWRFEEATAIAIPERDSVADMVCFFSVLTHLLHEDSFRYLRDAKRVLKPGGRIVFSFLEFRVYATRTVFREMVERRDTGRERVMDQFVSRDAIEAWADDLDLDIAKIVGGDENQIAEDGSGVYSLGQSVCVLEKNR
jgi:2-polyprenyl-3-methyl-5-hydroxy-6-metoxy-1,4-benzoquinol methylase